MGLNVQLQECLCSKPALLPLISDPCPHGRHAEEQTRSIRSPQRSVKNGLDHLLRIAVTENSELLCLGKHVGERAAIDRAAIVEGLRDLRGEWSASAIAKRNIAMTVGCQTSRSQSLRNDRRCRRQHVATAGRG